ncbi:DUF6528 family protein [Olivibacter sitiensis]|uniref:DUF6528 family protein n=1 Tax=Olivibacter sitiensis TaxID=376470 RepID=UPI00146FB039|nr:DUF6528 family protein [Olivibacter sitiensis]
MKKIFFLALFANLFLNYFFTVGQNKNTVQANNPIGLGIAEHRDFVLSTGDLVVCGDDQVFVLNGDAAKKGEVKYKWKWRASEAKEELPASYQGLLATLDECKPVDHHTKLLITSSGGATILLDIASKKVLFYAKTPMAHSADLLPNNRIGVANSTHVSGNSLEIYDIGKNEQVIYKDSLYSGHGIVWDDASKQLLALGFDELRIYELANWSSSEPKLHLVKSYKLPDEGGHDLSKVDKEHFLVSTHHGVWVFDTEKELFEPFVPLATHVNVKSANYDRNSDNLVFTIAEESWWTFNIYGENPKIKLHIPSVKLYKVRTVSN